MVLEGMKLSIRDLDLKGRRVFIRVDFNVPIKDSKIDDDTRIRAAIPTIKYATEHGARVILASHLGRPKGQRVDKCSLAPVHKKLRELLSIPSAEVVTASPIGAEASTSSIEFAHNCIGGEVQKMTEQMKDGDILLLENLRFLPEEEKNDDEFAKQLASLCDGLYVNDAFGAAHRAHASTAGISKHVDQAAAGLFMEKELEYLGRVITNPDHPFV